jgi:hypothetical protein
VTVGPPPVAGAACPNEPAGFALIQDQPWDVSPSLGSRTSLGWIDDDGSATTKLSIVADPTSPYPWTNHNVVAALFKQGDPGGSGPFYVYRPFAASEQYRNLYLCFYLKHDAAFENTNGNSETKFLWPAGDHVQGTSTYLTHRGADMAFMVQQQNAVDRELAANLNATAARLDVRRGQWVRYEILMKANTADGVGDGALDVWLDGVHTHQFTDVDWVMNSARTWQSLAWNPTYGGGTNPVPQDQYQYMDHIHISGAP